MGVAVSAYSATIPLGAALALRTPDGALLHVRGVLLAVEDGALCLVDGDAAMEVAVDPEKAALARGKIDWEVIATVLVRVDGGRRLVSLQSPSEFVLWWHTRGLGVTIEQTLQENRETLDKLQRLDSPDGIEKTPDVVAGLTPLSDLG